MQLGPGLASLILELHTEMGVPQANVVGLLRTRLGMEVTTGGLACLLHRTARDATRVYRELCRQVRNPPVVTPDETGWRVGAKSHWHEHGVCEHALVDSLPDRTAAAEFWRFRSAAPPARARPSGRRN